MSAVRLVALPVSAVLGFACVPRPSGPSVYSDPCADPTYLALKSRPADSLTDREFELLLSEERTCAQVRQLVTRAAAGSDPQPTRFDANQLETWTEPGWAGNQIIYIRNNADQAVWITSVELYECVNIRTRCGVRQVRFRLDPGQKRRLLIVDFKPSTLGSSYRYRYQVQSTGSR